MGIRIKTDPHADPQPVTEPDDQTVALSDLPVGPRAERCRRPGRRGPPSTGRAGSVGLWSVVVMVIAAPPPPHAPVPGAHPGAVQASDTTRTRWDGVCWSLGIEDRSMNAVC
jgi:hypothetical protein